MGNPFVKSLLVLGGVAAGTAGAVIAKKTYDRQSEIQIEKEALTNPRPGQRYGHFVCQCGKEWDSPFAWVGERQQCTKCDQWVDPKNLSKLDPDLIARLRHSSPHNESRCSRCLKYQKRCYDV
eukprot:Blabericola_migrator_1__3911@NODE_2182_length_3160_cov_87_228257_g1375_i0_p4_GENE_NODE_2182_length_3160_cov_87_228257_g1375_i0NODE_2182_length_3160_cov_87_228257_g1375_i0_p4_ORF_typecomplete_len123_score10_54zf3CxxC_2/PF17180_4/2_2e12UPF0515/PF15135_6/0_0025DUF5324/PF17258_2/0_031HIPIP/PF01355_17/2_7HIPIP/PF01355_17/7zf3CxxC/PF13695_6/3_8e03_NODE_2182_length_3160_cov_87_228257_g1375_i013681736